MGRWHSRKQERGSGNDQVAGPGAVQQDLGGHHRPDHHAGPSPRSRSCGRLQDAVPRCVSWATVQDLTDAHLRIARPTRDIDRAIEFWTVGVGLELLGRQREDHGTLEELAFIGRRGGTWHLEIVRDTAVDPTPTDEDILVLYAGGPVDDELVRRIEAAGGRRVPARNPYWNENGVTFVDPDGYWLVLATRTWAS
jgi:catechol 2,3-dioxygenase-like lactoylglutathione lyase family enzyme